MDVSYLKKQISDFLEYSKLYEFLPEQKINTIFIAGSLMEGFGNSKSDIDVFILTNGLIDVNFFDKYLENNPDMTGFKKNKNNNTFNMNYNDMDFDIEVYDLHYILDYIEELIFENATVKDNRYDLFHRLKYGEPIIGIEQFKMLKESVPYTNFNFLSAKNFSLYYPIRVMDIQGSFLEGAFDTSFHMSLRLLVECIDTILCINGETNPNKKWLIKKIERYSLSENAEILNLRNIFENAYYGIDFSNKDLMRVKTLEILKECQNFNIYIEKKIM